jgi:transposase
VIDWLGERDQAWCASITHVAIDMSATYAKAARNALPHAQLVVDLPLLRRHLGARDPRPRPNN